MDLTTLEGYTEGMTAEETLELLKNYEPPKPATEEDNNPPAEQPVGKVIPKAQFDKLASEYAALKKKHNATLTAEEAAAQEREEANAAMLEELETLRKEKSISGYVASLLSLGLDEAMAGSAATALAEGDVDTLFAELRKYKTGIEKALRAQILKETPTPPAGDNPGADGALTLEEQISLSLYGKKG